MHLRAAFLLVLSGSCLLSCGGERDVAASTGGATTPTVTGSTATPASTDAGATAASASPSGSAAGANAGDLPKDLNVLMISIDSLRSDRMGYSGYTEEIMPTVNAFEKASVSYTRFYSTSSFTSQTLGGFLGARYPSELKRSGYFFGKYPDDELMFPELLQKAGIRTMSAHAHFYFAPEKSGFHQGFDVYEIIPGLKKNNTTDENITSPAHTEIALKHLSDKANTKGRFFAWYHLLDPHDQYMGHPEGKSFGRGASKMYDGELYFTDMHVKKILDFVDAQPWGKRTMVIITSDHGEAFGEHKMYRHGFELWENLVHVPLMIRAPGAKPRRIDTPRSMLDVSATILDGFNVEPDASFQGTSLVPELFGAEAAPRDVIVDLTRTGDNDRRRALIRGNYKLLEHGNEGGFQLFDVVADPGELTDLTRKDKAKFEEMRAAMKQANAKIKEICPKMTEKLKGRPKGKPC